MGNRSNEQSMTPGQSPATEQLPATGQPLATGDLTLQQTTQVAIWENVRRQTRRRLTIVLTTGTLYLIASILIGGFLLSSTLSIFEGFKDLDDWESVSVGWIGAASAARWCIASAGFVVIFYGLLLSYIYDKLPSWVCVLMAGLPWIGWTVRMIGVGELCTGLYVGVSQNLTYHDVLKMASKSIAAPQMRRWSARAAASVEAGESFANILSSAPSRDVPLFAASVLVGNQSSRSDPGELWRFTGEQSHFLIQSRMVRTTQIIGGLLITLSLSIASIGLICSAMYMIRSIEGLVY